jgi:hypothetical protein
MKSLMLSLVLCLAVFPSTLARSSSPSLNENADKVLWRDPGAIAAKDLYWGPGTADRAPKPPFTFVRENLSGTKPKIDVTDAAGVTWSVKFALPKPGLNEVHAEVAATRLVWAFGYFVDENYFVPNGRIEGVHDLKRAAPMVAADGAFTEARFERKEKGVESRGEWHVEDNPFKGTRELAGLHTLLMLLSSWDSMPYNTAIIRVTLPGGGEEDRYVLTDLGATFGRMRGGVGKEPNRWVLDEYRGSRLVSGVTMDNLSFRTPLLGKDPLTIPLSHARWFAGMAAQLTDDQIRKAFQAAGASAEEVEGYTAAVRSRLQELKETLAAKGY